MSELSPGHQDIYDQAKTNAEKRAVIQEEIKNEEFGIRLLESKLLKPKYTEAQKQAIREEIESLKKRILDLQQKIAELE